VVTGLHPSWPPCAGSAGSRLPQPSGRSRAWRPQTWSLRATAPATPACACRANPGSDVGSLSLVGTARSGGLDPARAWRSLRAELPSLRRSPVCLQARPGAQKKKKAPCPCPENRFRQAAEGPAPEPDPAAAAAGSQRRGDVPALAARWRSSGPVIPLALPGGPGPSWQQGPARRKSVRLVWRPTSHPLATTGPLAGPLLLQSPASELPGRGYLGPFLGLVLRRHLPAPRPTARGFHAGRSAAMKTAQTASVVLPLVPWPAIGLTERQIAPKIGVLSPCAAPRNCARACWICSLCCLKRSRA